MKHFNYARTDNFLKFDHFFTFPVTVLLVLIPHLYGKVFCPWKRARVYHCGSDGKTYDTLCDINRAIYQNPRLSIAHKGPCEGDNISTTSEEPSDNKEKHPETPEKEEEQTNSEEQYNYTEEEEEDEEDKSFEEENNSSSEFEEEESKTKKRHEKPKNKKGKTKRGKSNAKHNNKKDIDIENTANNQNRVTVKGIKKSHIKLTNKVNNHNVINIRYWPKRRSGAFCSCKNKKNNA